MKKSRLSIFLVLVFILILLNGCYLRRKISENQYLTVTNIEIYNQDNVMLETELCSSDDIFLFDLSDNFKENKNLTSPTMSPISYIYAAKFSNTESLNIVIYATRKGLVIINNISFHSIDSEYNEVKDNYLSRKIEYDGDNVKITFNIEAPKLKTKYKIGYIDLSIGGISQPGFLKSPNDADQSFYAIFLSDEKTKTEDEFAIKMVNESLNTEYKLLSMVTNVIEDVNKGIYSYNLTYYRDWIYDSKHKNKELIYYDFDSYQQVYYQYKYYYDRISKKREYYVNKIYCNIAGYSIFGLSIESTIEDVELKMSEHGAEKYDMERLDSSILYEYEINHAIRICFLYNYEDKTIEYFTIEANNAPYNDGIYNYY